jgi:hypothetical protein
MDFGVHINSRATPLTLSGTHQHCTEDKPFPDAWVSTYECLDCNVVTASFPTEDYEAICSGKSKVATPAAIAAAQHKASTLNILKDSFDRADVFGLVDVGYVVEVPHEIFNETEFRHRHGVSMEDIGLKPNVEIVNEKGEDEQVLLLRGGEPRRLIVKGTISTVLKQSHMKHHIRREQPEEKFDQKRSEAIEDRGFGLLPLASPQEIQKKIHEHLEALRNGEATGESLAAGVASNPLQPAEGRFFGRKGRVLKDNRKLKRGSARAQPKKKGQKSIVKNEAEPSGRMSFAGSSCTGGALLLKSGGTASVRSLGMGSKMSSYGGGGGGDRGDGGEWRDFASVLNGTVDRNKLTGVCALLFRTPSVLDFGPSSNEHRQLSTTVW